MSVLRLSFLAVLTSACALEATTPAPSEALPDAATIPLPDAATVATADATLVVDVQPASSVRCRPGHAPTLVRATAHRGTMPDRTALVLEWTDPNNDVESVEYTAPGESRLHGTANIERSADGGPSFLRLGAAAFGRATRLSVRVRDRSYQWSNTLEVDVAPVITVAPGDACDAAAVADVCAAGAICTRYGDPSCRVARCQPDVRACPAGVTPIGFTATGAVSSVIATSSGTTSASEPLATSPCDASLAGSTLHHFVAPYDGSYNFNVSTARIESGIRITLRRRCAIGDAQSVIASRESLDDYQTSLSTPLSAGEEVYLLVSTPGAAREYGVAVHVRR